MECTFFNCMYLYRINTVGREVDHGDLGRYDAGVEEDTRVGEYEIHRATYAETIRESV